MNIRCVLFLAFSLFLTNSLFCQSDFVADSVSQDSVNQSASIAMRSRKHSVIQDKEYKTDTAISGKIHQHDPKIAACLSIIPGGGQIYNRKWWKLPIVYGTMAVASYFIYDYGTTTAMFTKEYVNRANARLDLLNPSLSDKTDDNILGMRNTYRTYMEISIAALAILYVLNIIDACVDAHLYYFDISDDLSMQIHPNVNFNTNNHTFSTGLAFTFNLK